MASRAKTPPTRHNPKFLLLDRRAQQIASAAVGADPNMLLDSKEEAVWLGVSVPWLEIGRCKGYGPPFIRLGQKLIKYRVGDTLKWLDERTHHSTSEYAAEEL